MENQTFIIEDELKKLPGKPGVYLMHGEKDDHLCWKGDQPEEPCQTVFSAEQEQGGQDRPDGDAYHPV